MVTGEDRRQTRYNELQQQIDHLEAQIRETWEKRASIMDPIPMGQPILVGHHSESRHRKAISRSDSLTKKLVEMNDELDKLKHTQSTIINGNTIRSTDSDAREQIMEKIEGLEEGLAYAKEQNRKYIRNNRRDPKVKGTIGTTWLIVQSGIISCR